MADRLTQLQDCLDQLLTQMFASIRYIDSHHPPGTFPSQPTQPQQSEKETAALAADPSLVAPPEPDSPELFQSRLQELARDLVQKESQIEALISVLPGVGRSAGAQVQRMKELDGELRVVEEKRKVAVGEREELLKRVDEVIVGIRRP